jgi:malectin (di-glucose binding ER protein)/putative pyrroloquinoline-quinone binding quinoprotein/PQQ enzyme-like repeat protein
MRLSNRAKAVLGVCAGGVALVAMGEQGCGRQAGDGVEVVSSAAVTKYDWMQFGGGPNHSGNNTLEQTITASNVSGLKQLFQVGLKETIEGQPVVLTNVSIAGGTHDVAFMTSRNGYLTALDAYSGAIYWQVQFNGTNITMSSPAIDPSRNYIYAAGIDGKLHKVNVGNGTEITGGGWPETASLKDNVEKDGTALTIGASGGVNYLYIGTGGYDGDGGDYQGHLTTINLGTGAQNVFNALCSNQTIHFSSSPDCAAKQSGIWAKAGVTFDSLTNRVYIGTGNGTFAPSSFYWGDSILALNPNGTGAGNGNPLDSYTPSVYQTLQNNDKDLGSTNMLILVNNGSKYPHLGMQSGKDAVVRLINLDNMSGQGAPGKVAGEVASAALTTGGEVQNPCATWINPADSKTWMYISSPSNGVNAYQLAVDGGGNPSLTAVWHQSTANNGGVTVANNVLYYASNNNLHALNPTTGAQLWNATSIGQIHWQTPTVANGVVYIGDNGREVTAFGFAGAGGGTAGAGGGAGGSGGGGAGGAGGAAATKINCGGPAASPFVADVDFAGGGTINHANTIDTSGVTNPAPVAVYQTARDGNFTYTIPGFTAGSSHTVRLHMAETYWSAAGSRLFNVSINGTQVLSSFDVFATAGAKNKAIVEQFSEPANGSGQYVIQATSVKDNSLISGIEIQ